MGMFGSQAPAAAMIPYDPSQLSGNDKLMMVGATMRDMGAAANGGDAQNVMGMRQLMLQRQMFGAQMAARRRMGGLFGSQAAAQGSGAGQGGDATAPDSSAANQLQTIIENGWLDPQTADLAMKGLQYQQPHIAVSPSGVGYNDKDPSWNGAAMPKVADGQFGTYATTPNGQRFYTGAVTDPAVLQAAAAQAGAIAGAQKRATAPLELVDVPQSDGSVRKLPLSIAAPLLAAQVGAGAAPGAGGGAAGNGQLGVTQSPAAATLANKRAETQAQNEALQPKELAALNGLDSASDLTSSVLHQILGDAKDPKTGQWAPSGKPLANGWTTGGVGEVLSHVPGTPSYDLDQQLEHIRAMTSMDELQKLRDNSPTGAGLGRVTQQEINLLAAMRGSLDQGQSTPQFMQNVRRQLQQLDATRSNRHQLYQDQFGNVGRPTPGATAPIPPRARTNGASAPPPAGAVNFLRSHPELAAQFDAKYGAGASRSALGQ